MTHTTNHTTASEELAAAVSESGEIDRRLREAAMARGAGAKSTLPEPYNELCRQIADAAHRVTDDHVRRTREAAGSDQRAFEVILSASIGAGLGRWHAAATALKGVDDAPA